MTEVDFLKASKLPNIQASKLLFLFVSPFTFHWYLLNLEPRTVFPSRP